MVVYGYAIDLEEAKWPTDEIEEEAEGLGLSLMTGYSVGAYTPEMGVIGVTLDGSSELFNPISVSELNMTPTEEQVEAVKKLDVSPWEKHLKYKTPQVMIWVDDDD